MQRANCFLACSCGHRGKRKVWYVYTDSLKHFFPEWNFLCFHVYFFRQSAPSLLASELVYSFLWSESDISFVLKMNAPKGERKRSWRRRSLFFILHNLFRNSHGSTQHTYYSAHTRCLFAKKRNIHTEKERERVYECSQKILINWLFWIQFIYITRLTVWNNLVEFGLPPRNMLSPKETISLIFKEPKKSWHVLGSDYKRIIRFLFVQKCRNCNEE